MMSHNHCKIRYWHLKAHSIPPQTHFDHQYQLARSIEDYVTLSPSIPHTPTHALATHESYNLHPGIVDGVTQPLYNRYWQLKALTILT